MEHTLQLLIWDLSSFTLNVPTLVLFISVLNSILDFPCKQFTSNFFITFLYMLETLWFHNVRWSLRSFVNFFLIFFSMRNSKSCTASPKLYVIFSCVVFDGAGNFDEKSGFHSDLFEKSKFVLIKLSVRWMLAHT